jgi:uncharacterized protein (TIGR02444 family)
VSLWDWASAAYARDGVAEACLDLQDRHKQSVALLLWAVWARTEDARLLARAAETARAWESAATLPLRDIRRALKTPHLPVGDEAREAVRAAAEDAELAAEKALLEALEAMTPSPRGRATPAGALRAAAEAWSGGLADDAIEPLSLALDTGLLFEAGGRHDPAPDHSVQGPMDDDDAEWERDLRARLAAVTQDHADLDAAIQALTMSPLPDMLVIGRLKRKKLALKDEIARIQDDLTPDIIA